MIRSFFRLVGLLLLALGFVFAVNDGTRSIADQEIKFTRLEQTWVDFHQASLAALKPAVDASSPDWVWDSLFAPLLRQPTFAVLGVLGLVLLLLFRRRRPLIGYSRG